MSDTLQTNVHPGNAGPPPGSLPRRITPLKVLLAMVVLGIVVMWVYAFGFAPRKGAYRVDDAEWRARAEQVCARYEAQRLELVDTSAGYIAEPTEAQMIERADLVDAATALLQASLDEVTAVQPASDRDRTLVAEYRAYVETMLADRRRYTEQLRAFDLQPYTETAVDGGSPVTNVITDFTIVNEMRSCTPPGELGGDT